MVYCWYYLVGIRGKLYVIKWTLLQAILRVTFVSIDICGRYSTSSITNCQRTAYIVQSSFLVSDTCGEMKYWPPRNLLWFV